MPLDVHALLSAYCRPETVEVLMVHGRMIAKKAAAIVQRLGLDAETARLVEEAAYLHDIGVCRVYAPGIGCDGVEPYITHGVAGSLILEQEGLPLHARICERHTGVGLTAEDIRRQHLPLPERDMVPISQAEKIICYSDLFFSKQRGRLEEERTPAAIRRSLSGFGEDKVAIFDRWYAAFEGVDHA